MAVHEPPPPPMPTVIPGLPDPNSGRVYRLRVGTWPEMPGAVEAFARLGEAGFNTLHEFSMEFSMPEHRVYVNAINARNVLPVVMRLGELGFMEIHVVEAL